jgi:hypothetical protein
VVLGLMGAATALTFFLLFAICLYHFSRGYVLQQPSDTWFWVILLLSFFGIVLYYVLVIEPEHRALFNSEGAA